MNKKIALSAIALFAVTLGLGILNPALATKPDESGEHKVLLCHAAAEENINNGTHWLNSTSGAVVIDVDNKGKMNGHFIKGTEDSRHFNGTHGDWVIAEDLSDIGSCGPEPVLTITEIIS
jgi:hypothetical protein